MSHLLFVETTGPGVQALEFACNAGHQTTLLWSPRYDFFVPPLQRRRAPEIVDRAVVVDDPRDVVASLTALRAAGVDPDEVDAVFSTMHMCALPAALIAEAIGARGTSPSAVAAARNKGKCRQILRAEGIPSLDFGVVDGSTAALEVAAAIGYPVIIKPVSGMAKVGTTIACSSNMVEAHFRQVTARHNALEPGVASELDGSFIVEEIAVGPLYSIEVVADGRSWTPLVVVRRKTGRDNPILELGSTVPCGLSPADESELGTYAIQICRALGLDVGIFHVEVIFTADGPRLVEVNPRIAGGAIPDLVRAATGCNLFGVLVELFAGGAVPEDPLLNRAAVSHSFLAAADDCTVRSDLPVDWFDAFRTRLHSGWTNIEAGVHLRRMDGNFDVYGVVRVVGEDFTNAEDVCAQILSEIEETLGVGLPCPDFGRHR